MGDDKRKAPVDQAYAEKSKALEQIIKPLRTATYEVDYDWSYFQQALDAYAKDYGGLDLNPDFQRGHVWTLQQKVHFIENVLRGVVSSSGSLVQFNCPNWDEYDYAGDLPRGMQCIDGLQRITAVLEFIKGEVRPFGLTVADLAGSAFAIKSRFRFRVAVHNFTRRADLLQHYLDLNAGGTPHSMDEIERVMHMRDEAVAACS
ncbi:DUF262 domain-containing protein [Duganella vulcania]|uniref:DUF262 domain-containing protein n=1 Tax=Duganella vulcania TaxID=2692166 RepID=A0A845GD55_9BURK|nr:DUF262 domain-containing protein [Duganella vulcania]MYM92553.1 DUF262 domain-containing protein [Duganella vulcania]